MPSKGDLLWSGRLAWTHDEDSMESIDIPPLPVGNEERCLLSVRNTSPTVDVTVNVGYLAKCHPAGEGKSRVWTAAGVAATDVITSAAHGLVAGDAVEIVTAGGGTGAAGTVYYVVGPSNTAAHSTPILTDGTDTFCLATARGSDSVLNITGTGSFEFKIAEEFFALTSFLVGKWVVGSSTAPIAGLTSTIVDSWPFASQGGRLMVEKSATTAGIFTVYAEIRRA